MPKTAKHVLAVDLGGTKVAAAVVNDSGRLLTRVTEQVDTSSAIAPVRQIVRIAGELAQNQPVGGAFAACAVAVPGLVRPGRRSAAVSAAVVGASRPHAEDETSSGQPARSQRLSGTVWAPNLPGWDKMPLQRRLQSALNIPVAVESDRNAAVLGEAWMGSARGKRDAVVLIIGTGIGAGILAGGEIVRGAHELSGCAGWLVVADRCREEVRQVGQLESFTAGPGIARTAAQRIAGGASRLLSDYGVNITTKQVADAAREGDPEANAIFEDAGRLLGRAVANIVSMFDPEVVILGGGMAATADLFLPALRASMLEWAQPLAAPQVKITVSKLGAEANLLGAAHLAFKTAGQNRIPKTTKSKKRQ